MDGGTLNTTMNTVEPQWKEICALEDIIPLGARRLKRADGVEIAVFRTNNDEVYAIEDRCPHKGGPLSQGIVFGNKVACPLHNWSIDLSVGEAVAPDKGCVTRFPAKVEGGKVFVSAYTPLPKRGEGAGCGHD
jgi:nitrite reductase (NADH) small subunit